MWALKEIDPWLPEKAGRDYDHRLGKNSFLPDLAAKIFLAVATILEDINKQAIMRATMLTPAVHLDAFGPTSFLGDRRGVVRQKRDGGAPWEVENTKDACQGEEEDPVQEL